MVIEIGSTNVHYCLRIHVDIPLKYFKKTPNEFHMLRFRLLPFSYCFQKRSTVP